MFQGVPRVAVVFGVVVVVILELLTRLPDIMVLPQRIAGLTGEYGGKAMQPEVLAAQVAKAQAEAKLAVTQAELNSVQQAKVAAETQVTRLQAALTQAQTAKAAADAQLAQMQTALAAVQADKTTAETRLTEAQTTKTNLENTQKSIGLALTAGMIGVGAKIIGGMTSPSQDTSQTSTAPNRQPHQPGGAFDSGHDDWYKWHNWKLQLPSDQRDGANFWANVRNNKPSPPACGNSRPQRSAGFVAGCEAAEAFLTDVDEARRRNAAYRSGWNAGATETGGD